MSDVYEKSFFQALLRQSQQAAAIAVPTILGLFHPMSVVDVGGGVGAWAAELRKQGLDDVITVDGPYIDADDLQVPFETFIPHDLVYPLDLGRKFDLVLSLEVAEHLEARYAPTFIDSLARHADLIVFSAAIPGQGGTNHVNEQWPTYWVRLFVERGYEVFDILRPRLWTERAVGFWFRQNMLVFARGEAAEKTRAIPEVPRPIDVVHPEEFEYRLGMLDQPLGIRESGRALRAAIRRRASRTFSSRSR